MLVHVHCCCLFQFEMMRFAQPHTRSIGVKILCIAFEAHTQRQWKKQQQHFESNSCDNSMAATVKIVSFFVLIHSARWIRLYTLFEWVNNGLCCRCSISIRRSGNFARDASILLHICHTEQFIVKGLSRLCFLLPKLPPPSQPPPFITQCKHGRKCWTEVPLRLYCTIQLIYRIT